MTRKPTAFRLSPDASAQNSPKKPQARPKTNPKTSAKTSAKPRTTKAARKPQSLPPPEVGMEDDYFENQAKQQTPIAPPPQKIAKTMRWGAIFFSAFTGLLMMWASVAFINLIEDLFSRATWLGWLGTGLLALAGIAALVIILREIIGLFALRKISKLQEYATTARQFKDDKAAKRVVTKLKSIYANRPEVAWGLANLKEHEADIINADDLVNMAERDLMTPLDEAAGQIIAAASRRVTLLTAITPAALLDILFVAAQNMKMLRQLAVLYGGRPGMFGTMKLAGMVVSHLAVTGGLALTDSLVQQFVGKGLLGRLSARFGEGAVNGILTTRIGLAALDLTRPIPFQPGQRPKLAEFLKQTISIPLLGEKD